MANNENGLRKTGIDIVGDMPWGTHFCYLYETREDLLSVLGPYFTAGLESNELCLWIVANPLTPSEAENMIQQKIPGFEQYRASGSLEIISNNIWYLEDGIFTSQRVLDHWNKRIEESLSRGYAGLRVYADESWLSASEWKSFLSYEVDAAEVTAGRRIIASCGYPLASRTASDVFDLARSHAFALVKRRGHWEVFETPEVKQTKAELNALKESLEGRVAERTRELAAANEEIRSIVDAIPAFVWTTLPDGTVVYANQQWLEYSGQSLKDFQDHRCEEFIHPEDRERVTAKWRSALASGKAYEVEERLLGADGKYRWFLGRAAPLHDKLGNIIKWYGTNTDIEERKEAEAALEKAFEEIQRLKDRLYKENLALKEEIDRSSMFEEIVGRSPALQAVLAQVAKVAPTDSTILITGETGTGKELIARAIHKRSARSSRAFVSVNCAAIPPSLIASELFGHEKGAFTGAVQRRLGRFELAEGGTIFLDEIGDLPLETQIALLRVLQERQFERVGGHHSIQADVRIIAATHRNLEQAIVAGTFRRDLFYRLNVFPVAIPSLRQRKEDIPLLVEYFVGRYASKAGKTIRNITKKTLNLLKEYSWPGNIRELQNLIERSVVLSESDTLSIDESWLSQESLQSASALDTLSRKPDAEVRRLIEDALTETKGKVSGPSGAADKLGIPSSTLESKIKSLNIDKHRFKTLYRIKPHKAS
jgi:PAS domain S-box-containing protein